MLVSLMIAGGALLITLSEHPLLLMFMLLGQCTIISISLWLTLKTSWPTFLLLLVFFGGMMILFSYMCSLSANNKVLSPKWIPLGSLMCLGYMLNLKEWKWWKTLELNQSHQFTKMNSTFMMSPMILLMLLLLLLLILVISMTSKVEGSLRKVMN